MRIVALVFLFIGCFPIFTVFAQSDDTTKIVTNRQDFIDYGSVRTYELVNIVITGTNFYDKSVLQVLSGLTIGQKVRVPSEDLTKVISNLYRQKYVFWIFKTTS
jgi:hypothetical protein